MEKADRNYRRTLSFSEILRKAENSFTEKESPAFSREKILEAEIRKAERNQKSDSSSGQVERRYFCADSKRRD